MKYILRKDIGAYEDLSVYERFRNAFLDRGRRTEARAGEPIGRRWGRSYSAPGHSQSSGQRDQEPLGARSARYRRQREAENRSDHEGPPGD